MTLSSWTGSRCWRSQTLSSSSLTHLSRSSSVVSMHSVYSFSCLYLSSSFFCTVILGVCTLDWILHDSACLRGFSLPHWWGLTLLWFGCLGERTLCFSIASQFVSGTSTWEPPSLTMSLYGHETRNDDHWQGSRTIPQQTTWRNFWCCYCCDYELHSVCSLSCFHCFRSCWGALYVSTHRFRIFDCRLWSSCLAYFHFFNEHVGAQSLVNLTWQHFSTARGSEIGLWAFSVSWSSPTVRQAQEFTCKTLHCPRKHP